MKFNRLSLSGFKFVDKAELPILDGLTGIVGLMGVENPYLDAIQWVMGETRPKSMRSGGMEDVMLLERDPSS